MIEEKIIDKELQEQYQKLVEIDNLLPIKITNFYKKKITISIKNTGIRQLMDQNIYPKNDGILIPFSSAIERTIKFGALPM